MRQHAQCEPGNSSRFSEGIVPEDGRLSSWLLSEDDYHWERLALEEEKLPYMSTQREYKAVARILRGRFFFAARSAAEKF